MLCWLTNSIKICNEEWMHSITTLILDINLEFTFQSSCVRIGLSYSYWTKRLHLWRKWDHVLIIGGDNWGLLRVHHTASVLSTQLSKESKGKTPRGFSRLAISSKAMLHAKSNCCVIYVTARLLLVQSTRVSRIFVPINVFF